MLEPRTFQTYVNTLKIKCLENFFAVVVGVLLNKGKGFGGVGVALLFQGQFSRIQDVIDMVIVLDPLGYLRVDSLRLHIRVVIVLPRRTTSLFSTSSRWFFHFFRSRRSRSGNFAIKILLSKVES